MEKMYAENNIDVFFIKEIVLDVATGDAATA